MTFAIHKSAEDLIPRDRIKQQLFGTFLGVFVPAILMVFGVIIFLRLGWIVGQAGIFTAFAIITFATLIAFITTLSMASISTNIEVGKGGVYYLLSRSLGIEVGTAIGIPLYLKQCLSISFCVIGFAESLHDLIPALSITSIGIASLIILTILAYFSLSGALKVQLGIFVILIGSLISLFLGGEEMLPAVQPDVFIPSTSFENLSFWALFAIFFPAMTGIESSVALSGDLKDPGKSLPLGTISALLVSYVIYVGIAIFLVHNVSLDLLVSDPFIMQAVAKVPALIVLGIWGATISSALGGLLGAPRSLQALAEDGVVPSIFGKNFGVKQEPRIATLTTCLIALIGTYFGSVNIIAPMLTMICLICYAILNFSAGLETLMANPSWRPRFQFHWSISILGGLLCILAMIMIAPGSAVIASLLMALIYAFAQRRKYATTWDDIRNGILTYFSQQAIYCLSQSEPNSKSWRPHFLVFAKNNEGSLLQFSQAITQGKGFITMASFVKTPLFDENEKRKLQKNLMEKLKYNKIKAFVEISYAEKVYVNIDQMIENYGLGPLKPNTILCGIHKDEELDNLYNVVSKAYQKHNNMIILNSKYDFFESKLESGNIDVWYHPSHKENGSLMLVLAYMLRRNAKWKKTKIRLIIQVADELERQSAYEEYKKLSLSMRIPLEIEVLISSNPKTEYLKHIPSSSIGAGMVFLSLAPPSRKISKEDYTTYLKSMIEISKEFPSAALILSSKFSLVNEILT